MSIYTKSKDKIPIELRTSWNEIAPELVGYNQKSYYSKIFKYWYLEVSKKPKEYKKIVKTEDDKTVQETNEMEDSSSSDSIPVEIETQKLDIPTEINIEKKIINPMKDIFIDESEILIKELLTKLQNPLPECNESIYIYIS